MLPPKPGRCSKQQQHQYSQNLGPAFSPYLVDGPPHPLPGVLFPVAASDGPEQFVGIAVPRDIALLRSTSSAQFHRFPFMAGIAVDAFTVAFGPHDAFVVVHRPTTPRHFKSPALRRLLRRRIGCPPLIRLKKFLRRCRRRNDRPCSMGRADADGE